MKFIKENFVIILSVLYILSPIDFIPEALLGPIGIIDDGGALLVLVSQLVWKFFSTRQTRLPKTDN